MPRTRASLDGCVKMACSICGIGWLYPTDIVKGPDGLYRCPRCQEETALEFNQRLASARHDEPVYDGGGIQTQWVSTPSFLAAAQDAQAQKIPGWTPTTTFYDDFTVLPGDVGSDWSIAIQTGTSSISRAVDGSAQLSAGTGLLIMKANGYASVAAGYSDNFYCAARASIATGSVLTGIGLAQANYEINGAWKATPAYYNARDLSSTAASTVEFDSGSHNFEYWWRSGGPAYFSVDGYPSVRIRRITQSANAAPALFAYSPGGIMNLTNFVAFVE